MHAPTVRDNLWGSTGAHQSWARWGTERSGCGPYVCKSSPLDHPSPFIHGHTSITVLEGIILFGCQSNMSAILIGVNTRRACNILLCVGGFFIFFLGAGGGGGGWCC